ncbi:MAG TPA: hypothetical protein VGH59_11930 [Casimicrobiaceae bacterium]|jgi:hypothetical protein
MAKLSWNAARPRVVSDMRSFALVLACTVAMLDACSRSEEKPLPSDPKARAEFVDAQSAKMSDENRRLLQRFMVRVKDQEATGGSPPTISLAKAMELQRAYDSDVVQVQKRYQASLAAAKAELRTDAREQALVNDPKSPSGKSLRYVLDMTNTGKKVVDRVVLRIDFRDTAGKYLASVPGLELKGPLKPGESGRTVQVMPLNPTYQAGLLEGKLATITATPSQIVYADGEKLDPDQDLKALETLGRARIP